MRELGFFISVIVVGCTTDEDKLSSTCPENASLSEAGECLCDDGFYGELIVDGDGHKASGTHSRGATDILSSDCRRWE